MYNSEGFDTYNLWCPQYNPSKHKRREYTAMIGENSKKKIKLIRSIDEFDYNNISIPDDELITAYVKLSSKEYYNITSSSIIVTDTIDDEEKDSYKCLQVPYGDCSLLDSFIDDFNDFTSFIKNTVLIPIMILPQYYLNCIMRFTIIGIHNLTELKVIKLENGLII